MFRKSKNITNILECKEMETNKSKCYSRKISSSEIAEITAEALAPFTENT